MSGAATHNNPTLRAYLDSRSIQVVPWSHRLAAVLYDTPTGWKYTTAVASGIPCIQYTTLLESVAAACDSALWVDTYKPTSVHDVIGHREQIRAMMSWLQTWSVNMSTPRGVFLSGPPGIGKTTCAHLVAAACKYSVVELNASDERSATAVHKWFATAAKSHTMGEKRLVIMDEVDGMSQGDRGGVGALAAIIKTATFPIFCIANDRSSPRMRPLSSACLEIKFQRPQKHTIATALYERVIAPNKLSITPAELEMYVEQNGNDIRQTLNFLQFRTKGSKDALLRMDPFSATVALFNRTGTDQHVFVDTGIIPLMVGEAYVSAASKGTGSVDAQLERCVGASDAYGMYDMLDARIHRQQAWHLLPAAVNSVVETAQRANGPAPFQLFPSWLGKYSKRRKHERWHRELCQRTGMTAEALYDARTLLRARVFGAAARNVDDACVLMADLNITRDIVFETLTETVFQGDEASVALDTKTKGALTRAWKKRNPVAADTEAVVRGADDDDGYVDDDEDDDAVDAYKD